MYNAQTTTFRKTVTVGHLSTEALIEITEGINRKGNHFRRVNFVNTHPVNSVDAARAFEDGEATMTQLIRVLNDDGYHA